MKREIYEVYAKIVDANGAYNTLSGYPKAFDSHNYNDDCDKARQRAYGEYYSCLGAMATRDDRQLQIAMIIRANDGLQIEKSGYGAIADLPDPMYQVIVNNGSGSGNYLRGASVTVSADSPDEGMQFAGWEDLENVTFISGDENTSVATFIMPERNLEITATYIDIPEQEEQ